MVSGSPDHHARGISSSTQEEQLKVSVTASNSVGTFTQQVLSCVIYNDGPNAIYYNRNAAATTSKFKITAKSYLNIDVPITTVNLICASGETATAYIIGVY